MLLGSFVLGSWLGPFSPRQYTWDKQLESRLKSSGILGGKGVPTIIKPKQYKARFREAMERYFLLVPDVIGAVESPGC